MTKKCATPDCTEEIQEWQNYCPTHYGQMMQSQQQTPAQTPAQAQVPAQTPVQTPAKLPKTPATPEVVKKEEKKTLPLPVLDEKDRVVVKQTCLQSAVELMKSMDNETKEFDQLMQEVETLTVYFYRTVVTKNENLS